MSNSQTRTFDQQSLKNLRAALKGSVFVSGDAGYDKARLTWDVKTFDQHPAIIVLPASTSDVQAAVNFANEFGLPVAVQGGGHGHPIPANNALLVNFTSMTSFKLDPTTATVQVEPGVLFREVVQAAHKYGLAPLNGFAATVGVIGYMLGGGCGWLSRQYGSGAGSILSLEVVTAEGTSLEVNEGNNPDLFWGLRGGGGNFGIVTSLECKLYPVDNIFGGQVVYPIEQGKDVLDAYLNWTKTAPDELTSALRIMHFPASPDVPSVLKGKSAIIIMACFNGESAKGEALLSPMRSLGKSLLDTFSQMPYSQVSRISNDPDDAPPVFMYNDGRGFRVLASHETQTLFEMTAEPTSGISMVEIRHLGGALSNLKEDDMAFDFHHSNFYLNIMANAPSPEKLETGKQAIAELMEQLKPALSGDILINFVDAGNVRPELTRAAYSDDSYRRLQALKRKYDPRNIFQFNHNIPPSA